MLEVNLQKEPINGTNCFHEEVSFESKVSPMMQVTNVACDKCFIASQKGNLWKVTKYAIGYGS